MPSRMLVEFAAVVELVAAEVGAVVPLVAVAAEPVEVGAAAALWPAAELGLVVVPAGMFAAAGPAAPVASALT